MTGLPLQPAGLALELAAKADAARTEQRREADAAIRQVEGLFLGMMLKEMRNTLEEGSLFGGDSSDVYGGLFDLMLSQNLSNGSPLGLSQLLEGQLLKSGVIPDIGALASMPSAAALVPPTLDAQF